MLERSFLLSWIAGEVLNFKSYTLLATGTLRLKDDAAQVRAIAAAPIPVISGVGYETDFIIADDLHAATPPQRPNWQRCGAD